MSQLSIIGMYPAQKQVHAEIGNQYAKKGKDAINMEKHRLLERFPKLFV